MGMFDITRLLRVTAAAGSMLAIAGAALPALAQTTQGDGTLMVPVSATLTRTLTGVSATVSRQVALGTVTLGAGDSGQITLAPDGTVIRTTEGPANCLVTMSGHQPGELEIDVPAGLTATVTRGDGVSTQAGVEGFVQASGSIDAFIRLENSIITTLGDGTYPIGATLAIPSNCASLATSGDVNLDFLYPLAIDFN